METGNNTVVRGNKMYYRHVGSHQRLHVVSLNPKQHPKKPNNKAVLGIHIRGGSQAREPDSQTLFLTCRWPCFQGLLNQPLVNTCLNKLFRMALRLGNGLL